MKRRVIGALCLVLVAVIFSVAPVVSALTTNEKLKANLTTTAPFVELSTTEAPLLPKPTWYHTTTFTYTVSSNGAVKGNLTEFASLANATLNDPQGWSRLDAKFVQVQSGGMFNLVLSQASLLPTYSSGCTADWSCRAGNNVVINDDRWMGATQSWNNAGGGLRDYRHMVVNHETGHWLGHDHVSCGGAGQSAPVMQQQSMDLQGCTFNPWPKSDELWSNRL